MRFCTLTLGCKVNQYETGILERILINHGCDLVSAGDGCDICIINTCAVTVESEKKSRQAIRRLKKLEPAALIAVCGCYSQLAPESVKQIGVDFLSGVENKEEFIKKTLEQISCDRLKDDKTLFQFQIVQNDLLPLSSSGRTRALLKIQDGCDNFCTYCIVPGLRGRSRSALPDFIAKQAKQLDEQGFKEIVITGIEISSYGKDLVSPRYRNISLVDILALIYNSAPNTRLRLGSLDPSVITDEFCRKLSEIPNLCNHFHLSLQSGCDKTLKKMGRKYNATHVIESIKSIKSYFPECAITADLITGFPGETDDDFEKTLDIIKRAAFSDMHIFQYSPRPGTKAADYSEQINLNIKKERARIVTDTAKKMTEAFKQAQIGKTLYVLIEQEKNGISKGHSGNYLMITIKEKLQKNTIYNVKITGLKNGILSGEII